MATGSKRQRKAHQALVEFSLWFETGMRHSIHNVLELKKANPPGLRNPVLLFVVPRAMNYVVERFVLEVVQAWELLNQELKRQGLRTVGVTDKHYRHLRKIRNKLVAHKIENSLATTRHENWYKREYGNFEKVLALVSRAAERIHQKIRHLETTGRLSVRTVSTKGVPRFEVKDIEALLAAAKAHAIY
jgi:hypothetical protein